MKLIQPDSEIKLWEKVSELSKLTMELIIRNDGRRYVSRRDLRRIWGCTDEAIKGYVRKGMPQVDMTALTAEGVERAKKLNPKYELSLPKMAVYDLAEVNAWKDNNVETKMSPKRLRDAMAEVHEEDRASDSEVVPDLKNYALREVIAKTEQAEEQAKISALKRKALEGGLVPSGELDRAMAEQALLHKADKLHDEATLPQVLEGKSMNEMRDIMRTYHTKCLNRLDELINKQYESSISLHDVVENILVKLSIGVELGAILKAVDATL